LHFTFYDQVAEVISMKTAWLLCFAAVLAVLVVMPACATSISATFVSETYTDYTVVNGGSEFVKSWTIRNSGTETWGASQYKLRWRNGNLCNGTMEVYITQSVAPEDTYTFSVPMKAPLSQGYELTYREDWEFTTQNGVLIPISGYETIWTIIKVPPASSTTCSVANEFTLTCPIGWQFSDKAYASSSAGKYVWLYLLWNQDTCISISKEDFRGKYGKFNLASASHSEMNNVYKNYLKDRPGSGSYQTSYLKTIYSDKDWHPFFISRCVGSVYGATPKDDQLYYYYEAITLFKGWRISLMCYTNTSNPRTDARDSELTVLEEVVLSLAFP
jgi:hypothetical protein